MAASSVASSVDATEEEQRAGAGDTAPWAKRVHESHELKVRGGFLFSTTCGAVAAVPKSRSGLFEPCPASVANQWNFPPGSKSRLERIKAERHPEFEAVKNSLMRSEG